MVKRTMRPMMKYQGLTPRRQQDSFLKSSFRLISKSSMANLYSCFYLCYSSLLSRSAGGSAQWQAKTSIELMMGKRKVWLPQQQRFRFREEISRMGLKWRLLVMTLQTKSQRILQVIRIRGTKIQNFQLQVVQFSMLSLTYSPPWMMRQTQETTNWRQKFQLTIFIYGVVKRAQATLTTTSTVSTNSMISLKRMRWQNLILVLFLSFRTLDAGSSRTRVPKRFSFNESSESECSNQTLRQIWSKAECQHIMAIRFQNQEQPSQRLKYFFSTTAFLELEQDTFSQYWAKPPLGYTSPEKRLSVMVKLNQTSRWDGSAPCRKLPGREEPREKRKRRRIKRKKGRKFINVSRWNIRFLLQPINQGRIYLFHYRIHHPPVFHTK